MNPSSLSFFDLSIGIDYHATRFQFDFPLFGSVQPCFFSTRFRKKSVKLVIEPRTTRRCFQASTNPLPRSIAFHRPPGRTMRRFIVDHDPDAALFFESSGSRRRCHCSPAVSVTDRKRSLPQKPNLLSRYTDGKREYLSLLRSDRLFFLSVYTSDFDRDSIEILSFSRKDFLFVFSTIYVRFRIIIDRGRTGAGNIEITLGEELYYDTGGKF